MGFGAKPQARSQGRQPPIISPFPRGRGWGIGIENFALLIKKLDFFDKLTGMIAKIVLVFFLYLISITPHTLGCHSS